MAPWIEIQVPLKSKQGDFCSNSDQQYDYLPNTDPETLGQCSQRIGQMYEELRLGILGRLEGNASSELGCVVQIKKKRRGMIEEN